MNFVPILDQLKKKGIKPGLSRTVATLKDLDNPQEAYENIHVAGTNGKGTTTALIANILKESGFRTGLYTSPELLEFNDRIKVDGQAIETEYIEHFFDKYGEILFKNEVTHFEAVTCLAFEYFRHKNIDYAVLETGMGGRFDATNVVSPRVFAITRISTDHQEFLGDTILQIAGEKAGIIKANKKGAIGKQIPKVLELLEKVGNKKKAKLFYAPDNIDIQIEDLQGNSQLLNIQYDNINLKKVRFNLPGDFQIDNLQTALQAVSLTEEVDNPEDIRRGIQNTVLKGRLELISNDPRVYYDVGHNPQAIQTVLNNLQKIYPEHKIKVVIALKKGKDYKKIGVLLKQARADIYTFPINRPEYYDSDQLYNYWKNEHSGLRVGRMEELGDIKNNNSGKEDVIWLITGTHGLASYVYEIF